MEAVVPAEGNRLRIFAAALTCIGKIGKEIFVEASPDKFTLRTLNDAKSAFCAFTFTPEFFSTYAPPAAGATLKCKIGVKAVQNVFRNIKRVDALHVRYVRDGASNFFAFELHCRFDIVTTHNFVFEECEIYQAVFDRHMMPHHLAARPAELLKVFDHIHGSDEVSIVAAADSVHITSYHSSVDAPEAKALLKTDLRLEPAELESFQFNAAAVEGDFVNITYSYKEFKGFLSFCDFADRDSIAMYYSTGGAPVLFAAEGGVSDRSYSADLVLATIAGTDGGNVPGGSPAQATAASMSGAGSAGAGGDGGARGRSGAAALASEAGRPRQRPREASAGAGDPRPAARSRYEAPQDFGGGGPPSRPGSSSGGFGAGAGAGAGAIDSAGASGRGTWRDTDGAGSTQMSFDWSQRSPSTGAGAGAGAGTGTGAFGGTPTQQFNTSAFPPPTMSQDMGGDSAPARTRAPAHGDGVAASQDEVFDRDLYGETYAP